MLAAWRAPGKATPRATTASTASGRYMEEPAYLQSSKNVHSGREKSDSPAGGRSCNAGQAGAGVPQAARELRIVGGARGARLAAVDEVLAAHAFHRGRRGQIDRGGGALLGGAEERAQHLRDRGREAAVVLPEARRDGAGVKAVGGDARAREPARQLVREQDVRELRRSVHPHRPVAARVAEVVQVDPTEAVRVRGDVHDAGRGRCP